MKHTLLSIIYFLSAAHTVLAMETNLAIEPKKDCFSKIELKIEHPSRVRHITNNSVVVAGSGGCKIIDLLTKEEKKLRDNITSYLKIDQDRENIALAHGKMMEVYSIKIGKSVWAAGSPEFFINSLEFGLDKGTLLACLDYAVERKSTIKKYNYEDGSCYDGEITNEGYLKMAVQPKTGSLWLLKDDTELLIYESADLTTKPKKLLFQYPVNDLECSSDGYVAVKDGGFATIYLLNIHKKNYGACEAKDDYKSDDLYVTYPCLEPEDGDFFNKSTFYPRESILAILLTKYIDLSESFGKRKEYYLSYWDLVTCKMICKELLSDCYTVDLSFSPDGETVTLVGKKDLFTLPVPIEVQRKKYSLYWFLLREIINNQNLNNEDIKLPFKQALLTAFRR